MKKLIPVCLILFACCIAAAQTQPVLVNNPFPKTISVSGSAEMEIVPDEIYVNVLLSEYTKRGEPKKDIETIKVQFLESCKAAGIPDSAVSIAAYYGSGYYDYKKRRNQDMLATITYQLKISSSRALDNLVEKLDDNATRNFQIVRTSHSNIIEFRKQLKIKAIQAAKEKGIYLAEAIDEKLGETITITEPTEWTSYDVPLVQFSQTRLSNAAFSGENAGEGETDFRKMKLRFEVNVTFALK